MSVKTGGRTRLCISAVAAVSANVVVLILLSGFTAPPLEHAQRVPRVQRVQVHIHEQEDMLVNQRQESEQQEAAQRSPLLPPLPALPQAMNDHSFTLPRSLVHTTAAVQWTPDFTLPHLQRGEVQSGEGLAVASLDRRARRKFMPDLARYYPRRAKRKNIQGHSLIRMFIDTEGLVARYEIIETEPLGVFERAIERLIKHVRYEPAVANGVAVADVAEVKFNWILQK